jgi:hypothetical protein
MTVFSIYTNFAKFVVKPLTKSLIGVILFILFID